MVDEYLTIKVDAGILMRKIKEWTLKKEKNLDSDDDIIFSVSINKNKTSENQPLYRGKGVAVWHNTKDDNTVSS